MNGNGITFKTYGYCTEFKYLKYKLICTNFKEILPVQYIPTIIQSGSDLVIGFGISPLAANKKCSNILVILFPLVSQQYIHMINNLPKIGIWYVLMYLIFHSKGCQNQVGWRRQIVLAATTSSRFDHFCRYDCLNLTRLLMLSMHSVSGAWLLMSNGLNLHSH